MSDPPKPTAPSVTIENLHAGQNLTIGSISVSDTAQIAREVRDARENIEQLSARLAVSHAMVVTFLDLIGKANIPEGEESRILIDTAMRFQMLEQKVRLLEAAEPQARWIREAVEFALAQGDIKLAETLLTAAMNQIEGVVQLRNGNTAKAMKLLARSVKVLAPLVKSNPKYAAVILQIGYILKTQADALRGQDAKRAEMLLAEAEQRFRTVASDIPSTQKTVADLAGALNGLANIAYLRGDAPSAIEWGEIAATLEPSYAYAWHDLLGAYIVLAQSGDVRTEKMLQVLRKLRATHKGFPGLDAGYLDSLEQSVQRLASADAPVTAEART